MAALLLAACGTAMPQTDSPNQVRDRGQTPVQGSPKINMDRGTATRKKIETLHGILVDASCTDRSAQNLRTAPADETAPASNQSNAGGVSAKGVTVDSATATRERGDVISRQNPDLKTRQQDPSCAVTGATVGFAILLDNGRLLNFDEGGNTMAGEAVQANPAGKAMLNGSGIPFKPAVTIVGRPERDRVVVQKIVKMQ